MRTNVYLFFFVLDFCLFLFYLFSGNYIEHGDLTAPFYIGDIIKNSWYLFYDSLSQTNLESINRSLFILPVAYSFSLLGFDHGYIVYSFFICLSLFISQVSIILLINKVLNILSLNKLNNKTLFFIGLTYSLTPWIREVYPAILFLFAYSAMPLFLLLMLEFKERIKLSNIIFFAVVVSFIGTTPHYLLFSFITYLFFLVFNFKNKIFWKNSIISLLVYLFLNIYWILSVILIFFYKTIDPGYVNSPEFVGIFSQNISVLKILQGQEVWISWFRYDSLYKVLDFSLFNILPLISFVSIIYFLYKRLYIKIPEIFLPFLFFFVLSLGGTNKLYYWLIFKSNFFMGFDWLFRVPFKFGYFYWIFLMICLASFISNIKNKKFGYLLLFLIFAYSTPQSLKYLLHYYKPFDLPKEYISLIEDSGNFKDRSIFISPYSYAFNKNKFKYETSHNWNPDRMSSTSFSIHMQNSSVGYYHTTFRDWQKVAYNIFYPEFTNKDPITYISIDSLIKLNKLGFGKLVIINDLVNGQVEGGLLIQKLIGIGIPYVKYSEDLYVFDLGNSDIVEVPDGFSFKISKINPARYILSTDSNTFTFKQVYDPLWSVIYDNKRFFPQKSEEGLNLYTLPKFSGNQEIIIEYYPQTYFYYGLLVSIATLISLVVYLVFEFVKGEKKRNNVM